MAKGSINASVTSYSEAVASQAAAAAWAAVGSCMLQGTREEVDFLNLQVHITVFSNCP